MPHNWEIFHSYIEMWLYNQHSFGFLVFLWFLFLCPATQLCLCHCCLNRRPLPLNVSLPAFYSRLRRRSLCLERGLISLRRRLKETASAVNILIHHKNEDGKKKTADVFRKDRDQLWLGNWNLNSLDILVNIQESIVFWK